MKAKHRAERLPMLTVSKEVQSEWRKSDNKFTVHRAVTAPADVIEFPDIDWGQADA